MRDLALAMFTILTPIIMVVCFVWGALTKIRQNRKEKEGQRQQVEVKIDRD